MSSFSRSIRAVPHWICRTRVFPPAGRLRRVGERFAEGSALISAGPLANPLQVRVAEGFILSCRQRNASPEALMMVACPLAIQRDPNPEKTWITLLKRNTFHRLDYQPLFWKVSPRPPPEPRSEDRTRESGKNRAFTFDLVDNKMFGMDLKVSQSLRSD